MRARLRTAATRTGWGCARSAACICACWKAARCTSSSRRCRRSSRTCCTFPSRAIAAIRESFASGRATEAETSDTIAKTQREAGYLLDPHTAVGVAVGNGLELGNAPVITLATAHPAKFPAAVKAATGIEPPLPAWLSDLYERPERYDRLANDLGAVEDYVRARSRAGRT